VSFLSHLDPVREVERLVRRVPMEIQRVGFRELERHLRKSYTSSSKAKSSSSSSTSAWIPYTEWLKQHGYGQYSTSNSPYQKQGSQTGVQGGQPNQSSK
jgi:hypothetical protein